MNQTISSMVLFSLMTIIMAIWWIRKTFTEGSKALQEIKKNNKEKFNS
tara:strand:- start:841 stop:984 length:144 start_codon:yes stop_codon:yes gene_type:complete